MIQIAQTYSELLKRIDEIHAKSDEIQQATQHHTDDLLSLITALDSQLSHITRNYEVLVESFVISTELGYRVLGNQLNSAEMDEIEKRYKGIAK